MLDQKLSGILIEKLRDLQLRISRTVWDGLRASSAPDVLAAVAAQGEDDTIYAIDKLSEDTIIEFFENEIQPHAGCALVAEGFDGGAVFTSSGRADDAEAIIIMDPVDGSRGLMHGKRSAWSLAGAAPNLNHGATLAHIELAVQTEIPQPKQSLFDQVWAIQDGGASGERLDFYSKNTTPLVLQTSRADNLLHGFATFNRFFPGVKDIISEIEEQFARRIAGYTWPYHYFEDQYICSGGQLYELMSGRDRFVCDIRGLLAKAAIGRGDPNPLCCHPYDLCTELIAREIGVIVKTPSGRALSAPLDTTSNVSWIAYANEQLHEALSGPLKDILLNRQLI